MDEEESGWGLKVREEGSPSLPKIPAFIWRCSERPRGMDVVPKTAWNCRSIQGKGGTTEICGMLHSPRQTHLKSRIWVGFFFPRGKFQKGNGIPGADITLHPDEFISSCSSLTQTPWNQHFPTLREEPVGSHCPEPIHDGI